MTIVLWQARNFMAVATGKGQYSADLGVKKEEGGS